jgi:hypothetical protein
MRKLLTFLIALAAITPAYAYADTVTKAKTAVNTTRAKV